MAQILLFIPPHPIDHDNRTAAAQTSIFDDKGNAYQLPKDFLAFSASVSRTPDTKEEIIQTAYDNRSEAWKTNALEQLRLLAIETPLICADNLVPRVCSQEEGKTYLNAITGVFNTGIKKGWIEHARCSCGEECKTTQSKREGNNGRRIQVYHSLLY